MSDNFKTSQENFWSGEFGDNYISRNNSAQLLASNINFFAEILRSTNGVRSVIELGSNVGMNLKAIMQLIPNVEAAGVEINQKAYEELLQLPGLKGYHASILDFTPDYKRDLSLIKGVLIHINPDELTKVYDALYNSSSKYICIAEYYNPSPVELKYRGHEGKLFKRDFAGEMMQRFPDLKLVKYGFAYHKDNLFPQDDITWFLFEKN
jgi:pseudaminic acid biosynthesis-associated methylase